MSDSSMTPAARAPWHLWVVGILSLLWNCVGAMDYLMWETRNASYLSGLTPEQLAFFTGIPAWTVAAWAIGVWGGVLGSVLLLLRRQLAVWVFLASLVGAVVTPFQNYVLSNGMAVMGGPRALVFVAVIILIALGLYLYARAMRKRGVLV